MTKGLSNPYSFIKKLLIPILSVLRIFNSIEMTHRCLLSKKKTGKRNIKDVHISQNVIIKIDFGHFLLRTNCVALAFRKNY